MKSRLLWFVLCSPFFCFAHAVRAFALDGEVVVENPRLSITNVQGEFMLSWPASASDWLLEQAVHAQAPWMRVSPSLYQNEGVSRYL
ncbi:MAG: hypothetical protein L0Z53_15910, partial [Acidobacteriales bacterium]|nr:hypothetical protein [Terriglobales bacterium]